MVFVYTCCGANISTCSSNADCRLFSSDAANECAADVCECSDSTDLSEYCSDGLNMTDTFPVAYTFAFNFHCSVFFSSAPLQAALITAISKSSEASIPLTTSFTCGSTNAIVVGDVPLGRIVGLGKELGVALDGAVEGTEMEGTRIEGAVQMRGVGCVVESPVAAAVKLSAEPRLCVATECESGYQAALRPPQYVLECVSLTASTDNDDDLSSQALAGLILGGVFALALLCGCCCCLLCGNGSGKAYTVEGEQDITV